MDHSEVRWDDDTPCLELLVVVGGRVLLTHVLRWRADGIIVVVALWIDPKMKLHGVAVAATNKADLRSEKTAPILFDYINHDDSKWTEPFEKDGAPVISGVLLSFSNRKRRR